MTPNSRAQAALTAIRAVVAEINDSAADKDRVSPLMVHDHKGCLAIYWDGPPGPDLMEAAEKVWEALFESDAEHFTVLPVSPNWIGCHPGLEGRATRSP